MHWGSTHISRNSSHGRAMAGFTLLELMITVAVAAVLMMVAIPAYQGMIQRNTMTSVLNDLVGDINYARSEAITRGAPVVVCPSINESDCAPAGDWRLGWIVRAPNDRSGDNLLRVHGKIALPSVEIKKNTIGDKISFGGSGFADAGSGTLTLGEKQGGTGQNLACIVISLSGHVRTVTDYYGSDASDCKKTQQNTT